jgi:hypothetical protein
MAVLCPRCWHPAAEDERRCPQCGDDLFDQLVVLLDEPQGVTGRAGADPSLAGWRDGGPRRGGRGLEVARTRPGIGDSAVRFGPLDVGDERIAAQTLVISRVIGLAPAVSEAALNRWWHARSPRAVVDAGYGQLQLGPPVHRPDDGSLCHMSADLHRRFRWRSVHLELDLTPWSSSRTELNLRPRRRLHNLARYFCAGQATLDRIAAELIQLARG